jgi:hypothetical protein
VFIDLIFIKTYICVDLKSIIMATTERYFRLTFDVANKHLIFSDLIQTGAAFLGLVQITDPNGTIVYQGTGYDLVTPTWAAPDTNGTTFGTANWIVSGIDASLTSAGLITPGVWTADYVHSSDSGITFTHVQKTFNFDYISPAVSIDMESSCRTSQLIVTDATELTVQVGGNAFEPISLTRTRNIQKPLGSGANTPAEDITYGLSGTDLVRTIGGGATDATRLWTRVWGAEIELALQYNIEVWGGLTWVIILDTVTGSDYIDVRCDDSYCNLRLCVENAIALWTSSMNSHFGHASELQTKVVQILAEWTKYEMAERCGTDTTVYITNLTTILSTIDCTANYNPDDNSHVVYAIGTALSGGSSGDLPTISYGSTFPAGGISGSLYIYRDSATAPTFVYVMYNSGGTWIQVATILGPTGAAGADGDNSSSANIIYNGLTDVGTDAGTGEKVLGTYSVPGSTLVTAGDYLELVAVFDFALNANGKAIRLYFGGDLLCTFFTDALIGANNKSAILRARIHKVTATSEKFDAYIEGQNGFINSPITGTAAKNLATTLVMSTSGQNSVAAANDIICKSFTVNLFSVLTTIPTALASWDAGTVDLVADTLTQIPLNVTMPSSAYRVFPYGTDVDGEQQFVKQPKSLQTTTSFYMQVGVNSKVYWRIEM